MVASGLISGKAVVMSAENKNFQTFSELTQCMKASMLLPGIAGDAVRLKVCSTSMCHIAVLVIVYFTVNRANRLAIF